MNESLELFQNLIGNGNYLDALRMLFHYPLGMWLDMYFTKMRDAKGLLRFVSFCRDIVDGEKDSISPEELERFDAVLIGLELSAYDRANDFDRYIALFEDTRKNKLYAAYGSAYIVVPPYV